MAKRAFHPVDLPEGHCVGSSLNGIWNSTMWSLQRGVTQTDRQNLGLMLQRLHMKCKALHGLKADERLRIDAVQHPEQRGGFYSVHSIVHILPYTWEWDGSFMLHAEGPPESSNTGSIAVSDTISDCTI